MTVKSLILASKIAPEPAGFTWIAVEELEYPIPALITLTSDILWFIITGLKSAPEPLPVKSVTIKSGVE